MNDAPNAPGITIVRVFDAPPELVFKAWTEPEQFAHWFGGRESEVPLATMSMDVRPGGTWSAIMIVGPNRTEISWKGEYVEVVEPERLVFTLSDQPGDDRELVSVTLTDLGDDRTEMVFHQTGNLAEDQYARAKAGWSTFFDVMAELLAAPDAALGP
jgi:uncharacterized protein YndB with AHSA1/START domain